MTPSSSNMSMRHNPMSVAAGLNLILGIWLFVSPWVYGAYTNPNAWNSWIVGALIAIIAAVRLGTRAPVSWINAVLAVWVFFSPWIYGYTINTGRFINSLCVGVVVFILAISAASMGRTHTTTMART